MEPGPVLDVVSEAARKARSGSATATSAGRAEPRADRDATQGGLARDAAQNGGARGTAQNGGASGALDLTQPNEGQPSPVPVVGRPHPSDRALMVDREALKTAIQLPQLAAEGFDAIEPAAFGHPAYVAVKAAIAAAGGAAGVGQATADAWVSRVLSSAANDAVRSVVTELAVEPLRCDGEPDRRYVEMQTARVQERRAVALVAEAKGRLSRIDPADAEAYNAAFAELFALEQRRRSFFEKANGGE